MRKGLRAGVVSGIWLRPLMASRWIWVSLRSIVSARAKGSRRCRRVWSATSRCRSIPLCGHRAVERGLRCVIQAPDARADADAALQFYRRLKEIHHEPEFIAVETIDGLAGLWSRVA